MTTGRAVKILTIKETVLTNLLNFAPYTDLVVTSGNLGSILLGNDDTTKKLR